ncbi:MAG: beta strand repeat-containing protein [Phycisphaerae bacterium]
MSKKKRIVPSSQMSRHALARSVAAVLIAAGIGQLVNVSALHAATFTTSNVNVANVEQTAINTDQNRVTAQGASSGYYADYSTMEFSTQGLGLSPGTALGSVSSLTLNLSDLDEYFAAAGPVKFYLSTVNTPIESAGSGGTPASYSSTGAYGGIGTTLGTESANSLYFLGSENYTPGQLVVNGQSGPGEQFTYNFPNISSSLSQYVTDQVNSFGNLRLVVSPGNASVSADYVGPNSAVVNATPPLTAPSLSITGSTVNLPPSDAVLSTPGLTTDPTTGYLLAPVFSRVVQGANVSENITLQNTSASGKDSAYYTVIGQSADAVTTLSANTGLAAQPVDATGAVGTEPLAANTSTQISVGLNTTGATLGPANSVTGPTTGLVTITNQSNAGRNPINVLVEAQDVVKNRTISNVGGSNGVNFGNILILPNGQTNAITKTVQLTTTNSAYSSSDPSVDGSQYFTTVELNGSTTIAAPTNGQGNLNAAPTDDLSYLTMAADPNGSNTTFNGTQVETRQVTYYVPGTESFGGSYETAGTGGSNYYIGNANFNLTQLDNAVGATQNPTGSIYVDANIYQSAQLTDAQANMVTGTVSTAQLADAAPTANYAVGSTSIGLRDNAIITRSSPTLVTSQTAYSSNWNLDSTFVADVSAPNAAVAMNEGSPINAAEFNYGNLSNLLNGHYEATIGGITAENAPTDASGNPIQGASTNDLGTHAYSVTATVSGFTGVAGTPNTGEVIAGQRYASFSIQRSATDAGSRSTMVQFIGGTASANTTLGVEFSNAPAGNSSIISDVATVSGTNSDRYVLQMSYNPSSVTNGTLSPVLAWKMANGQYEAAYLNDTSTANSAGENNEAYDPTYDSTIGTYGIDTTNHTVWAVLNYSGSSTNDPAGQFAVMQRLPGDALGTGTVNISDLNVVLHNLNQTYSGYADTWSVGDFTDSGSVSITDLNIVLHNLNSSTATASSAAITTAATPEPGALGLLATAVVPLLLRRRNQKIRGV